MSLQHPERCKKITMVGREEGGIPFAILQPTMLRHLNSQHLTLVALTHYPSTNYYTMVVTSAMISVNEATIGHGYINIISFLESSGPRKVLRTWFLALAKVPVSSLVLKPASTN